MATLQEAKYRVLDVLPTAGLFPGEIVALYDKTGSLGNYTYSVKVYVWDAAEDAWEQIPTLSDNFSLTGDLALTGALTAASLVTTGAITAGTTLNIGAANITEAELEAIDGVTLGVQAASKVLSTDANLESDGIGVIRKVDVLVPSASVLALFGTPVTIIPAPAAGSYVQFLGAYILYDFATTAYAGIAAGEDLVFKYTNAAGAQISQQVETTGFLDQVADEVRIVEPVYTATAGVEPVDAAPVVLHLLVGEIITGDSPLKVRAYYRLIRKAALEAIA